MWASDGLRSQTLVGGVGLELGEALLPSEARVLSFLVIHKVETGTRYRGLGKSFWMLENRVQVWHPSWDAEAVAGKHG